MYVNFFLLFNIYRRYILNSFKQYKYNLFGSKIVLNRGNDEFNKYSIIIFNLQSDFESTSKKLGGFS